MSEYEYCITSSPFFSHKIYFKKITFIRNFHERAANLSTRLWGTIYLTPALHTPLSRAAHRYRFRIIRCRGLTSQQHGVFTCVFLFKRLQNEFPHSNRTSVVRLDEHWTRIKIHASENVCLGGFI